MTTVHIPRSSHPNLLRTILGFAAMGVLVFGLSGGAVVVAKSFTGGIMVIWPVDAVILALMLGEMRRRPLLALLVAKLAGAVGEACGGEPWLLVLGLPLVSGLGTWVVFLALRRFTVEHSFTHSRGLLIFLAAAALASFINGVGVAILFHSAFGLSIFSVLPNTSASNAVGYSVITPLVLILLRRQIGSHPSWRMPPQVMAIIVIYCASVLAIFFQSRYQILYVVPLGLMMVAYTADLAVVAVVIAVTTVIAFVSTALGHGPIAQTLGPPTEKYLMLQLFLIIITAASLPMAALMAEHRRLKTSLTTARHEAEAANQAKSAFLANISHEIRTPLNGVLGMAQAMAMHELSPDQRSRVDVVRESGENLLALINNVLDLAKIEAGKVTLELLEFDLGALLRVAVVNFDHLAKDKGLELTLDMGQAEGTYLGDPTRIRQILFNLISNALKFTAAGAIRITAVQAAAGVGISVSDTGIGIPAGRIEQVFAKFSQVDDSTTRRFGGTGLGLPICRELASLMNGTVDVESKEGHGSCFTLALPLERLGESVSRELTAPPSVTPVVEGLRVLAAEDNATNQLVLRTLLEAIGVEVVVVDNGAEAVEAWEQGEWDLILMDVQMPVLDGVAATQAIRLRESELGRPRTWIIAVTANTLTHQVEHYLKVGMDAHLAKPIEAKALFAFVAEAAERITADSTRGGFPAASQTRGSATFAS